ncbi:von Willebrand factor type A domain protein [Ancylostoma caninum]|uniref:von Willebrand factor type A domain protein n=1 Tax=Ancylostoma caninum TaxID=29170 RepID=A0A368FKV6_ANCCA|nr:von Willebrand factor type A domain protein [Ancylostoma caninum]
MLRLHYETEAPLTSIFDESAFGTVTVSIAVATEASTTVFQHPAITSTSPTSTQAPFTVVVPTLPTFAESSTASSTTAEQVTEAQSETANEATGTESSSASTVTATFAALPEETEEPMEPEAGVVMKERPTNFGDQNMMKEEIEKEMLEGGVTEVSTAASVPTTVVLPPGVTPAEEATTTEEPSAATSTSAPPETVPEEAPTVTTEGTAVPETPNTSAPPATESPPTVAATTPAVEASSISTVSTEAPPFEAAPGMFEATPPTVAHRQPLTEETATGAEEPVTTFHPSTEEVQPIPDAFAMPKGPCPTPNDESDVNRSDVLFLLDSSNSFTEQKFMHAIQLILDTVAHFRNIGPNGTQVSLVQYNTEPYLEFSLRKHNCKQWLIEDIADTDYMQGGNMLGKAVEKVARFAFTKNRGDRPDAENVLVVLTDGQSNDRIQEPVEEKNGWK